MVNSDQSPALDRHRIQLAGISDTGGDFDFEKVQPRFCQVVACLSGWGLVWLDGAWTRCSAGSAFITPAYCPHAYCAVEDTQWSLCWVIYMELDPNHRMIASDRVRMVPVRAQPLASAIEGLWHESVGKAEVAAMDYWSELIHLYAQRIINPSWNDVRLEQLLSEIAADIARPWTIDDLAERAGVSREHLRRLFQSHLGSSPMHHVTRMRMRQAATLLASTPTTVEVTAARVGYSDPFAFSVAFKRTMRITPSDYRHLMLHGELATESRGGTGSQVD